MQVVLVVLVSEMILELHLALHLKETRAEMDGLPRIVTDRSIHLVGVLHCESLQDQSIECDCDCDCGSWKPCIISFPHPLNMSMIMKRRRSCWLRYLPILGLHMRFYNANLSTLAQQQSQHCYRSVGREKISRRRLFRVSTSITPSSGPRRSSTSPAAVFLRAD